MGHQYKNSKDIKSVQTDLATIDLDVLALFTAQVDHVDVTITGADADSNATAIAAIVTNLVAAGIMAES